jgi:tetratricopeptide (TPR) repeat protein
MNVSGPLIPDNRRILACMLLLATVTFVTYANSLSNGFVWDDHQILESQGVMAELPSLSQVFGGTDTVYGDTPVPYYRPLHRYIHLLELRFFGLNPRPFHAVNVLLHVANVQLLFRLALRFIRGIFPALVTALLFAVHPVNSEGINFITSRQNMWALFFTLAAGLVYFRTGQERRTWQPFVAALFFLGGLCCKETALMPLVFLAMALLFAPSATSGTRWRRMRELAPFCFAMGIYAALRFSAIPLSAGLPGAPATATLLERLGWNLYVVPKYAFNLALPVKLSAFYAMPATYPFGDVTLYAGWLLVAAFLLFVARRHTRVQILALLWLAINWLPISNIIPIPSAPLADRYLYLPAASIWFLAGCLAEEMHDRLARNRVVPFAVGLAVLVLALLSMQRNQVWKNDLTLFSSIARAEPWSGHADYTLGKALFEAGRTDEARQAWERTITILPGHSGALNCLGNLALMSQNLPLAEKYYRRSITTDPDNAEAHYNLALIFEQGGRYREARRELELFLRRVPPEYQQMVPAVRQKLEQLPQSAP